MLPSLYTSKLFAGLAMVTVVVADASATRGMSRPLLVALISSIADISAAAPVEFMLMFCPFPKEKNANCKLQIADRMIIVFFILFGLKICFVDLATNYTNFH